MQHLLFDFSILTVVLTSVVEVVLTVILGFYLLCFLDFYCYIRECFALIIKMDLVEGQTFDTYIDLEKNVENYEKSNFVVLTKRDTRTIDAAKKRCPKKSFKEEIKYSELKFSCIHSGSYRQNITTGQRPQQRTEKMGCGFEIAIRASQDGQQLVITKIKKAHNHELSKEEFQNHRKNRSLKADVKTKVKNLLSLNADKKLIKNLVKDTTGHQVIMKDIHNVQTEMNKLKKDSNSEALFNMLKTNYPSYNCEVVSNEGVIEGFFLQNDFMKKKFAKFPELIICDSTHKLNYLNMPLFTFLVVDGNGETQPICMFFIQNEDESSLKKMIEIFKNLNPSWVSTKTVLTDKDLTERLVFKSLMPQINLQICLFHVLRTFSREITTSKMNITESERMDLLQSLQEITYSKSSHDFNSKVESFFENAPNQLVKSYFRKNWLNIKEEWVLCFRHEMMNLGENTTQIVWSLFLAN